MVPDRFGFTDEEILSIKDLVSIAIQQGSSLEQMFPSTGPSPTPLEEEAAMLYLQMTQGVNFTFGVKPQPPDPRDLAVGAMPKTPLTSYSLEKFLGPRKNQGNSMTCGPNAASSAVELEWNQYNQESFLPSRRFIYYTTKTIMGEFTDDGVYLRDLMKSLKKYGYPSEASWPFTISKLFERPPSMIYEEASVNQIKQYLSVRDRNVQATKDLMVTGYPIIFAMNCFEEFNSLETMHSGVLRMPRNPTGEVWHCIFTLGFSDQREAFRCVNSYGPVWGDHGMFWMPYQYFEQYTVDSWAVVI